LCARTTARIFQPADRLDRGARPATIGVMTCRTRIDGHISAASSGAGSGGARRSALPGADDATLRTDLECHRRQAATVAGITATEAGLDRYCS
jgi:hypothetical protein